MTTALILASASPRRRELLTRVGVPIEVRPADVDERARPDEPALSYVRRVAAAKAEAIAYALEPDHRHRWVLGADTIVEIDGTVLGKADSPEEAATMLARLVGETHRVTTAFALRRGASAPAHENRIDRLVTTEVKMRHADDREIADYVAAGEWRGKAGAYAVQGMAAALVESVRGSITNVIGLPLSEVLEELARVGASQAHYQDGVPAS